MGYLHMVNQKTKKIVSIVSVIIVVLLTVALIVTIVLFKSGDIDEDRMLVMGGMLSSTLMTVVVICGAVLISGDSVEEKYLEYLKEKEKEK